MTKSVERMLSMRNIDIEASSKWLGRDGLTCLQIAVVSCRIDIFKLLIEKGANLEANDSDGFTPLYWAVISLNIEMVQFLCDLGANIDVRDEIGRTPFYIAVLSDNLPIVKELIERKADVNARDDYGQTALGFAKRYKKVPEMINYLISIGCIE